MPSLFLAAVLILWWDYPRALVPDAFLLTAERAGHMETLRVVPSTRGTCQTLPDATEETFCAQWPGCPADGVTTIRVQAVVDGRESLPTPDQVCLFSAVHPCTCLPVETARGVEQPPPAPAVSSAPPSVERPAKAAPAGHPASALVTPTPTLPLFPPLTTRASAAST